jgi:coproporphyrinogen III oxidase
VWEEQTAMQIMRQKGAHKEVMPKIQDWCDESAFVHWRQESKEIPSFAEVHQRMMTEGIFTRLSQPSSAHLHKQIPAPKSSRSSGIWLHPKKQPGEVT